MVNKILKNQEGFSILEIALVVVIFGIMASFGVPVFNDFKIRNDLDIATNNVVNSLRRAQILSQAMENDSQWGVYVTTSQAIIFQGESYVSRDASYDESLEILSTFKLSGLEEVVFRKMTGNTSTTGSIVISTANDESRTITVNSRGTVSF